MAIADDILVDYNNRIIYHNSSGSNTVYTVNALYSYLMDLFDDVNQMDDDVPMDASTPTNYQMINSWYIQKELLKYLKGGSIDTIGYDISTYGSDGVRMLKLEASGWYTCSESDIGTTVAYSGGSPADTGTLLDYDNTNHYLWIRTGDDFSDTTTAITVNGNTSSSLIDTGGSLTGEEIYANLYTLGAIESSPYGQVYIYQNGDRIPEWSTLSNFDRGHIDILIKVKEMGTLIDSGYVHAFLRQGGDTYSDFSIDLSGSGRNAVPLATTPDINYTDAEYYLLYDNEQATINVGDVITGNTSGAYAEVSSVVDNGTTGILGLIGVRGSFQDNENLYVGTTYVADANGTLGDAYLLYDNETANFTVGNTLTGATSGAKRKIVGLQDDGTTGVLCLAVDTSVTGTNKKYYYMDFQDNETISDGTGSATANGSGSYAIAGFSDITVAFVNGTATYSGGSGTFTLNEKVTWNGGSDSAILLYDDGTDTLTLGNVTNATNLSGATITGELSGATRTMSSNLTISHTMNKAFDQQSAYPYAVIIEGGSIYNTGRPLNEVYEYLQFITRDGSQHTMYTVDNGDTGISTIYGEEYTIAYTGYTPIAASPFGQFAGGTFFGAQGIWVEGMSTADANNLQLKDANGNIRTPYSSVVVQVTSLAVGDTVAVFLDDGTGKVDKDTYTSAATGNNLGDSDFVIQETIPIDTPSTGRVRVVDTSAGETHVYRYASWSSSTFTFPTTITGSCTSNGSYDTLIDSGATFTSSDIKVGDIVRNTTDGAYAYVKSIDSDTQITTSRLSGGATWDTGDGYSFHTLVATYDGSDTAYVPYIDEVAESTTVSKVILYNTDRNVIVKVRNYNIKPFQTYSTITSSGMNVAAIRTTNNIVS